MTLAEIDHRLNQLHNWLMKLESNIPMIYDKIYSLSNKIVTSILIDPIGSKGILHNIHRELCQNT